MKNKYYVVRCRMGDIYLKYRDGKLKPTNELYLPTGSGMWKVEKISRKQLEEVKRNFKESELKEKTK